jgi:hypothetical protein
MIALALDRLAFGGRLAVAALVALAMAAASGWFLSWDNARRADYRAALDGASPLSVTEPLGCPGETTLEGCRLSVAPTYGGLSVAWEQASRRTRVACLPLISGNDASAVLGCVLSLTVAERVRTGRP